MGFPARAQQSPATQAVAPINLPDLATAAPQTTTLQSTGSGLRLEDTQANRKFILTPEYSDKTGASLGAAFALSLGERAALGLLVNGGARKAEVLLNAGVRMDDQQRLIFTAGRLRQTLDYAFASGTDKATTVQTSGALSYEWRYAPGLLQSLEFNVSFADTPSRDLDDKTYAVSTAGVFELWNDPRRIAGGRVTGVQGRLGFVLLNL